MEPELVNNIQPPAFEYDNVHHPRHYTVLGGKQAIHIIATSMTHDQFYGYCMGNILKYRLRAGEKGNPEEDLAKANKYRELYDKFKYLCIEQ